MQKEREKSNSLDSSISIVQKLARFREKDDAQAPSKMEYLREKKIASNDRKKEYFEAKADAFSAQVGDADKLTTRWRLDATEEKKNKTKRNNRMAKHTEHFQQITNKFLLIF